MPRKSGKRIGLIVASFVLAAAGTWFVYETLEAGQEIGPPSWRTLVATEDMAGVAEEIRTYHKEHGRYPSNAEGLAVLGFDARFAVQLGDDGHRRAYIRWDDPDVRAWRAMDLVKDIEDGSAALARFRTAHGRAPQNQQELGDCLGRTFGGLSNPEAVCTVELGIDSQDCGHIVCPAGVLSPWAMPYVYENRRDAPAGAFDGSPADADDDVPRLYSAKVDEGIYIYSVTGMEEANRLVAARRSFYVRLAIAPTLFFASLACLLPLRKGGRLPLGGMGVLLGVAVGIVGSEMTRVSCYAMSFGPVSRPETSLRRRRELLDRHLDQGLLTQAAYDAAVSVLDDGPGVTSNPASRPATTIEEQGGVE